MLLLAASLLLSPFASTARAAGPRCADDLSCSPEGAKANPCCVPSPAGLFVFKQRFEPDVGGDSGSWGIDGLEVLDCQSQETASTTFGPSYTHEEIASYCLTSELFGGERGFERAESEWAQSEVGEGVEEVWERSWNSAGRLVSTLAKDCHSDRVAGQEVPEFFHTLHKLHGRFPTAKLLADADITPASDTTYSLAELVEALSTGVHKPVVTCDNSTLDSVLWPLQVYGTFQFGSFEPSTILSRESTCPAEGIHYPLATTRVKPSATDTFDPLHRPTPRPITLSHDENRLYHHPEAATVARENPKKLGLFKAADEDRDEKKEERAERGYWRDEL